MEKKVVYNTEEIMRLLPHRYPFMLVDRVLELEIPNPDSRVGRKIKAIKNVTYNQPYFPGHFPGQAVMPGVLQIEAMAQIAALACIDPKGNGADLLLVGVNEARFRRQVVPGDQLVMSCEILKERNSIMVLKCWAEVDGLPACQAEIMAKFSPR